MKAIKILFVVTEDWYFRSHRLPLAVAAAQAGYEVAVSTRLTGHKQSIEASGVRIIPLMHMKRSSLNPFREMAAFLELFFIFRRDRPDVVHLVALKPVLYGSLAAKLLGVPARVNALGGLGFIFSSERLIARLLRPMLIWIFRFIFNDSQSRLILQNEGDLHLLVERARVDSVGVHLIRGAGVDLNNYTPHDLPTGAPVVVLASRMLWDKGVGEFVKAAGEIKAKGINARFVLVGEPDKENPSSIQIEQLNEWHLMGIVEWWGYCIDMPKVLSESTIVCLPTYYGEGVPKVLLEAMACGRPIVTTDIPGCKELVVGRKNGLLVRPRDSIALANSLSELVLDRALCHRMGLEGRRIAEKEYSLKQVTDETLAIYRKLLNK
jgi:glycosyltransferase involved in cell wall biosynthesis